MKHVKMKSLMHNIIAISAGVLLATVVCSPGDDGSRKMDDAAVSFDTMPTPPDAVSSRGKGQCLKGDCEKGTGTYIQPNGSRYTGSFKDGVPHGKGRVEFANGDVYDGEWDNDRMQGAGTYVFGSNSPSAGDRYVGEWRNDMMHGKGAYTFGPKSQFAGDTYVGEYRFGKKNGFGTYRWSNGSRYEGEWMNDNFHGTGSYLGTDGKVLKGRWENDTYLGK